MSETFQSTFYNGTIQNITYMACMPPKICYWSQCNTYTIKSFLLLLKSPHVQRGEEKEGEQV